MTDIGDKARDLHREALSMDPRALSPIKQAHAAADGRLQELRDMHALAGKPLSQYAPDELMVKVESMCAAASIVGSASETLVWASLLAVCLEGWCAADRAEMVRVDTGEAA